MSEPTKVTAFDKSKRKPAGQAVDLDAPFFNEGKDPPRDYSKCDHTLLGFEYSVKHRTVYCRCGEPVDPFDAIVAMAHAERRLQSTREAIDEHNRKKAEEKAKKPFVKEVRGEVTSFDREGLPLARIYHLECGHEVTQYRGRGFTRHWRKATCVECFRASELAKKNVAVLRAKAGKAEGVDA